MKLLEIGEVTKHETPGKIVSAFGEYLSHADHWFSDRVVQQLKGLAAALIRQGFHFEVDDVNAAKFTRGDVRVLLPTKHNSSKDQGKVVLALGNRGLSGTHRLTIPKATRLDYNAVDKAHKAIRDAELELAVLLR